MTSHEIARLIDHAVLHPTLTRDEVRQGVIFAREAGCAWFFLFRELFGAPAAERCCDFLLVLCVHVWSNCGISGRLINLLKRH